MESAICTIWVNWITILDTTQQSGVCMSFNVRLIITAGLLVAAAACKRSGPSTTVTAGPTSKDELQQFLDTMPLEDLTKQLRAIKGETGWKAVLTTSQPSTAPAELISNIRVAMLDKAIFDFRSARLTDSVSRLAVIPSIQSQSHTLTVQLRKTSILKPPVGVTINPQLAKHLPQAVATWGQRIKKEYGDYDPAPIGPDGRLVPAPNTAPIETQLVPANLKLLRDATVAIFRRADLLYRNDGMVELPTFPLKDRLALAGFAPVCSDLPFANSPSGAIATGFVIAPRRIATARHVFYGDDPVEPKDVVYVIGYYFGNDGTSGTTVVPKDNVYDADLEAIATAPSGDDWAIMKVQHDIFGVQPLKPYPPGLPMTIGLSVAVIGHPSGLPALYTGNAQVKRLAQPGVSRFFRANLDCCPGNSGSPVFDLAGHVVGILVASDHSQNFDVPPGRACYTQKRFPPNGESPLDGETCTPVDLIRQFFQ
ncbi:MAG: hypothetical protein JWN40_2572 [Phycisphaerales bacterium]|nr:hypothetical protein [Phycisphaerales bacterium]